MTRPGIPFTVWGQLITSVLCSLQILGSAGCSTTFSGTGDPLNPSNPLGLLINRDPGATTLGAIRLPTGESVFVFGQYSRSGLIERIDGAVLVDQDGKESSVLFENSLVKSARTSDGSSLAMQYDEVSTRRIKGRADVVFGALDGANKNQTFEFDIDLERAAAEVAEQLRESLGIEVSDEEPPDSPDDRRIVGDPMSAFTVANPAGTPSKEEIRSQLLLVFLQFHAAAFATLGYVLVEIVSALVGIIFEVVASVVVAVTRAVVIAMFTPIILLGEVMRAATRQPIIPVNFDLDIDIEIPGLPRS